MKKIASLAAIIAGLAALPAMAQQAVPAWYIGLGAGVGKLNQSGEDITGVPDQPLDDGDTAYTIRGGYRFHPNFAVELGYHDLGKYSLDGEVLGHWISGTAKASSYSLSLVAIAPVDAFDLYGRLGWEESESKVDATVSFMNTTVFSANVTDRESGAIYGLGARWNMSRSLGLFVEWNRSDKAEVDTILAGIDFRF
jgi:OOP family OmpA-OmpF porin